MRLGFAAQEQEISIHALREEGDSLPVRFPASATYFYPRPPRGGRLPWTALPETGFSDFYPRPPRGGRPFNAW